MTDSPRRRIPEATLSRLPIYLRILGELSDEGITQLSSDQMAALAGVNAAKVRKDLSYLGTYGTRGVGYDVAFLTYQIQRELGLTHEWPIVVVGAGNLGQALSGYGGFTSRGYPVVAMFDSDLSKVDTVVGGVRVRAIDDLPAVVQSMNVSIGVLATPGAAAQEAADLMVRAGITSILNFAPVVIATPRAVRVRKVDLASELQILSYYEDRRQSANPSADPARTASA